ncbi:MAG TPA: lamin tail domain-containing protein, partial [Candidatus Heimdallarchaeota archaeon]|nr:lamin tail domain-containing protein [Candidatus Heimdallarchaeota archaeon]
MTAKRFGVLGLAGVILALLVGSTAIGKTLVINEIAWAGSAANGQDEWIELCNVSDEAVDLTGWALAFGEVVIHLGE